MRILIAGAAGFIGWNLSRQLRIAHPDWTIQGVDNLWTGVRRPQEYVDYMMESPIERVMRGELGEFDYVYHLASPASPKHYQSDPHRTVAANVLGLMACMQMVRPTGTIFMASTSEVYGDPVVSPQPENYWGSVNPVGVRSCYDESKRLCETMCMDYHRTTRRSVKIARLFNVYGPGTLENDGRAMSNFVCQMLRGQPLTVYGRGSQTRCFTYVDDVVRAIVLLTEGTRNSFVGPINIGSDVETSVTEIAQAVLREGQAMGVCGPREIEYLAPAVDDPQQRRPDLTLARRVLRWGEYGLVPYAGEAGGIARTIRYFQELMR